MGIISSIGIISLKLSKNLLIWSIPSHIFASWCTSSTRITSAAVTASHTSCNRKGDRIIASPFTLNYRTLESVSLTTSSERRFVGGDSVVWVYVCMCVCVCESVTLEENCHLRDISLFMLG